MSFVCSRRLYVFCFELETMPILHAPIRSFRRFQIRTFRIPRLLECTCRLLPRTRISRDLLRPNRWIRKVRLRRERRRLSSGGDRTRATSSGTTEAASVITAGGTAAGDAAAATAEAPPATAPTGGTKASPNLLPTAESMPTSPFLTEIAVSSAPAALGSTAGRRCRREKPRKKVLPHPPPGIILARIRY